MNQLSHWTSWIGPSMITFQGALHMDEMCPRTHFGQDLMSCEDKRPTDLWKGLNLREQQIKKHNEFPCKPTRLGKKI